MKKDTCSNQKKLLFVVNVDWFFVSHRLPIALAAIKKGYEVHLACGMTDKKEYLEGLELIVHPIALSRSSTGLMKEFTSFKNIYQILKRVRPDIVHFVTIKPVLYGGISARILKIRNRVFAIPGLGYVFNTPGFKNRLLKHFIVQLYKLSLSGKNTKVIVQNSDDQDVLLQYRITDNNHVTLIRGSGVDLTACEYQKEPDGIPVVTMAARLLRDKGIYEFLEAARLLHKQGVEASFRLYGDIDEGNRASLTQEEVQAIIEEGILQVYGFSNNIADIFAKSNIVVLPSYREGLPKVLIEAAACGRAVVTTDVPGCRDAIDTNRTGLLCKVKDAESLAGSIEKLLKDKTLREKMGKAGRELAQKEFDIEKVVEHHLDIYQSFYENKERTK